MNILTDSSTNTSFPWAEKHPWFTLPGVVIALAGSEFIDVTNEILNTGAKLCAFIVAAASAYVAVKNALKVRRRHR